MKPCVITKNEIYQMIHVHINHEIALAMGSANNVSGEIYITSNVSYLIDTLQYSKKRFRVMLPCTIRTYV